MERVVAITLLLAAWPLGASAETAPAARAVQRDAYGAVFRGDRTAKKLSLIFTGDEFGEGAPAILDALKQRGHAAAFFVTGNFLRRDDLRPYVRRMVEEGHYVGPHSDRHLLYCDWDARDQSLVPEEQFAADLKNNLDLLHAVGAPPRGAPVLFVPPYEWYNDEHVRWTRRLGAELISFTPGTGINRDYAREGDPRFVPAERILEDVLAYERREPQGLNGFLLLAHLGSGRDDPFHPSVGELCDELSRRGYEFVRIDALLEPIRKQ